MAEQLQLVPISASIDNPDDWEPITDQITRASGLPLTITTDAILGMIRGAIPLVAAAQAAGNAGLLRGTFADPVVAQCQRNGVRLLTGAPDSVVVHLVGGRMAAADPLLRVHVVIRGRDESGEPTIDRQFWDLEVGAQVTLAQATCPNCGAQLLPGELICDHCRADVRSTVQVPLVVSRLELY